MIFFILQIKNGHNLLVEFRQNYQDKKYPTHNF